MMKKFCDVCKKSVKEVGKLYRLGFLDVCKRCREILKRKRLMKR